MDARERAAARSETPATLVWIDTDDAIIVRWHGSATIERITSDVPPQERSTGHVRHDPAVHHDGDAAPDDFQGDREARLDRFIERVAACVPPDDPVRIVGPGVVCTRLGRLLRAEDRRFGRRRAIGSKANASLTERQLVADIRAMAGRPAPRRTTREHPPTQEHTR